MELPLESSLIVPVPAADAVIEPWRAELDPFSAYGMEPHVTVIYPFLEPATWPADLTTELAAMFAEMPTLEFELDAIRWFEPNVAWAAPHPAEPFGAMTAVMRRRWPELRPYGGTEAVEPHLTIGVSDDRIALERAALAVGEMLPIACRGKEVLLMTGRRIAGAWTTIEHFPLGVAG